MVVLIDQNGDIYNCDRIMDQMSKLKFNIDVLQEWVETQKSASNMMEDRMSLLRNKDDVKYENIISLKQKTSEKALKNNMIRKYHE